MIKDNVLGAGAQCVGDSDEQSIGQLGRMDVLQSQAMAPAQSRGRSEQSQALIQALRCIEEGELGVCIVCANETNVAPLRAVPAISRCMICARGYFLG